MERVGIDCHMYRNKVDDWDNPDLADVDNIRDVTKSQEWGTAEFRTRGKKHKRKKRTLLERALEFQMEHNPDEAANNDNFVAFRDAFEDRDAVIELYILDGTNVLGSNSQGLHAHFIVTKFERVEPLEDAVIYDVSLDLAVSDRDPEWYETPAGP